MRIEETKGSHIAKTILASSCIYISVMNRMIFINHYTFLMRFLPLLMC